MLVDDDGKLLEQVDYPVNSGNEDEAEPVEIEMASFLASTSIGVRYGPKSLLEQWRESNMDDDYNSYDDDIYEGLTPSGINPDAVRIT
ncbi:hypothetical protein Tco_0033730 [Tanacetum coccineum]